MKSKEPVSPFLAVTCSLREKRSSFAVCHSSSGVPRVWFTGQTSQLLSCSHGVLSLLFVFGFLSWKLSSSSLFLRPPLHTQPGPGPSSRHIYFCGWPLPPVCIPPLLVSQPPVLLKQLLSARLVGSLGGIGRGVEAFWVVTTGGWALLTSKWTEIRGAAECPTMLRTAPQNKEESVPESQRC